MDKISWKNVKNDVIMLTKNKKCDIFCLKQTKKRKKNERNIYIEMEEEHLSIT